MVGWEKQAGPGPEKSQSFLCFTLPVRWWKAMDGFKQEEDRILKCGIFVFFT